MTNFSTNRARCSLTLLGDTLPLRQMNRLYNPLWYRTSTLNGQ